MTQKAPRFDGSGIALLLAGGACVLPFVQPRHLPPLRAFYDEWLAFALFCSAFGFAALGRERGVGRLPAPALWVAAFGAVLLVRCFVGQPAYVQSPAVWAIYALFAAAAIMLGHQLALRVGREQLCDTLAVCLLSGALLNAACAALQVTAIPDVLSEFVAHTDGLRATGNVGQANLYANYIALGQGSVAYLFARGKLGAVTAIAVGGALVVAASLAGSRASILYAAAYATLGFMVLRFSAAEQAKRMAGYVLAMAATVVFAQWAVPAAFDLWGHRIEGGIFRNAESSVEGPLPDEAANLRLAAWSVALRLVAAAPLFGVGPDEFPGAAYLIGLPAPLADGTLWTSPHNLLLHLASETGLIGAGLVIAAALAWVAGARKESLREKDAAMLFLAACVAVQAIHSFLEYPLWYAHFLGFTAFVVGASTHNGIGVSPRVPRAIFWLGSLLGGVLLSVVLASYLRFDAASPAASGRSLADDAALAAQRSALAKVSNGLLSLRAETWLFLAYPLDTGELEQKVSAGHRVMRTWPSREVVCRHAVFLALSGRKEQSLEALRLAERTFPGFRRKCEASLDSSPPETREILLPLLR